MYSIKSIIYVLLIITQVFADDIKESKLDDFANSLSYSVTNKQVFINIPTYYAPWNNLSVFQYKSQDNILWASNSSSFFINSSANSTNYYKMKSNITQLNLPDQIGAVYNTNQPNPKFDSITYVSPILNESINNNKNVSFIVLINYTNSDSLYALINASFD